MIAPKLRDWEQIGVDDEVFVSRSGAPLRRLPTVNFLSDEDDGSNAWSCDSGHCFV